MSTNLLNILSITTDRLKILDSSLRSE